MADNSKSLNDLYPRRYEVPVMIAVSCILLGVGLSLPLVNVEKLIFWKNEYSVFTGVVSLARQGELLLAAILIVAVKMKPLATVQPQVGVYMFGLAILLSMVTTGYIERLAPKRTG